MRLELTMSTEIKDVDMYIAMASRESQAKLSQLRAIIKATAPEVDEIISYKI
jgi:uncharacterized protein YdhG (YjbR/CyaY superfamily)